MEVKEPSQKYLANQICEDSPGWQSITLGTVASFRTGPFGSALHKSDYVLGGVPVVNPMQIEDGRIKPTERMSITEDAAEQLTEFRLKSGDVVIGRRGEMGRCAVVRDHQEGWLCGTGSMIVRPGAKVDGRFLQRVLSSNEVVRAIESSSVGTTMINLNQRTLADLELHIPVNVEEQSAIAHSLNDAGALIDSLAQLLTKKRQIKQGAMQELITGKRRLPGFTGQWKAIRLGDIGRTYGGLTGKSKADFGHGAGKYVTFMNVMTNTRTSLEAVESVHVEPTESQNNVQPGDLLFNGSSETPEEVAFCSWVEDCAANTFLNSFCFGFRPSVPDQISGLFMAYYFRSRPGRMAVSSLAQGATRYNIAKTALLQAPLSLPAFDEQQAIASILSAMDEELSALESRLTKARALKQAMAQALLTGRIRLVEPTA